MIMKQKVVGTYMKSYNDEKGTEKKNGVNRVEREGKYGKKRSRK